MSKYAEVLTSLTRTPEIYGGDVEARRAALTRARFRLAVFDGGVILLNNFGEVQAAEPERPEILGDDWSGNDFFRELLISSGPYYSGAVRVGPDGRLWSSSASRFSATMMNFFGVLAVCFAWVSRH